MLVEPTLDDVELMGSNWMNAKKSLEVAQLSSETTALQIRTLLQGGGRLAAGTVSAVRELARAA